MVIRKVELEKFSLSMFERGTGQPLLLVHGFPLDHTMWAEQCADLSDDYRVLAPDLRGFGGSDRIDATEYSMQCFADDLAELLDQVGVDEPIVFCGLSMGGYIAWQFWQYHRERLRALILCDTRAAADAPEVARARRYMANHVMSEGTASLGAGMVTKLFAQATLDQQGAQLAQVRQVIANAAPESIAAAQRGMAARPDMTEYLAQIDLPTLLIAGEEDVITTPDEIRAISEQLPGSEFHLIAEAGHMAPTEQPQAVNSVIRQFLTQAHFEC
ncbi:MAG: alpha/beta fold hydrolase [Planctomycetaceae bacterium]|nr:alpha/beta fold hydrolase [Planctomycetaceae bacterium]